MIFRTIPIQILMKQGQDFRKDIHAYLKDLATLVLEKGLILMYVRICRDLERPTGTDS
jgi:hypothetical protein